MRRTLPILTLLALAPGLRAQQLPLFTDGTAFGGSRVFAEGLNPLSNPARFSPRPGGLQPGTYGTYVTGGFEAVDFKKTLDRLQAGSWDEAFKQFAERPWGQRTTAMGLALVDEMGHFSLTRESTTSLLAVPDLAAAHLGPTGLLLNTSTLEARRAVVDRLVYGLASSERSTTMGASMRIERWSLGKVVHAANPGIGQKPFPIAGQDAFGFNTTDTKVTTMTLDAGLTVVLGTGLQVGLQVDRLAGKKIQDVDEKPQTRAGLQFDLGTFARLSVEADLNAAARMPYPVAQKNLSASLAFQLNPSMSLTIGAERRKIGELTTTRTGATLKVNTAAFVLGAGFQVGADQPMRGAMLRIY